MLLDGPGVSLRAVCAAAHEKLFDCNHDDYFNTSPQVGSYLDTSWNAARSSFLDASGADVVPPIASAPTVALSGASPDEATVPVRVAWRAAVDDSTGVAGYELSQKTDGGAYVPVSLGSPTATGVTLDLPFDHTYRFMLRAVDLAGNRSVRVYSPTLTPDPTQESSGAIVYRGSWSREASGSALAGFQKGSEAARARARFAFSGREIAWVARKGPNAGRAYVYVDDLYAKTVDLYAATANAREIVFRRRFAATGAHTIAVWVAGTKNRPRVDIDAFLVLR